jgi:hypothetical protein
VDKHTLAIVSIVGSSLDVLGALYLAYDLLGGQEGPLRALTRVVTYSIVFGLGFGIALGPFFGLVNGAAHGITLTWEYSRASRSATKSRFWRDLLSSAIRGAGFGIGGAHLFGLRFGAVFAALSTLGALLAYRAGIRPTLDYQAAMRPRLTKRQFWTAMNRVVGYTFTGYASAAAAQRPNAFALGIKTGLAIGAVSVVAISLTPFIEWTADNMPQRRMGVLGIGLILIGFSLQSVQYWVALLDIPVR